VELEYTIFGKPWSIGSMQKDTIKHRSQIEAFHDAARFKFILAGRRAGKTFLITEHIVKTIHNAKRGQSLVYLGPTLQQSKELIWRPLIQRLHQLNWKFRPVISKSRIELSNNRSIYVLGAERIARVRGQKFIYAYLDEVAFFSESLFEIWRALRPTLTDYRGGAICATTPNGKGTSAYDFYMDILQKEDWKYFHWKTIDNPFISKDEIENAKRELDEKGFRQEYEASWESFQGLAYYNFDELVHVKKITPDLSVPIHLCLDYNVSPTTLLLSQFRNGILNYFKEYSYMNSSTEVTLENFVLDFSELKSKVKLKIRGDASGNSRKSTTGKSDHHYITEILTKNGFNWDFEVAASNPPIIDRVNTVNSWLKPYQGSPKIVIDPSCKDLIRDLSSQEINGRIPSDKNNLGHKADALGYDIFWQHMLSKRPQSIQTRY
jgi:PBSX family phage terminase large subunit